MTRALCAACAPAAAAKSAEITNTFSLCAAASMPIARAATSEPCSARSARPRGESMRLCASHTAPTSAAPTSQYQVFSPEMKAASGGTAMPSGPPVTRSSVASTIETMMPKPRVAIASA